MSQFLSDVHFNMYEKILRRNEFTEILIGDDQDLRMKVNESLEEISLGKLEEILDLNQIHASLDNLLSLSDKRLALVLKSKDYKDLARISENFSSGLKKEDPLGEHFTMEELFMLIRKILLLGMPCSGGLSPLEVSDKLIFKIDASTYEENYDTEELIQDFFIIKLNFLRGYLEDLKLNISLKDQVFTIEK